VSALLWLHVAIERCPSNTKRLANLSNCVLFVSCQVLENLDLLVGEFLWPTTVPASCSGCLESCIGSLSNNLSLKLSQCAKDMKD
jgi:hypothetical protein